MQDCADQTLVASLPDFGDHSEDSGEVFTLDLDQIPKSLEKDDKSVKLLIRTHGLSVMREERKHFWLGIYRKRESFENIEANKGLYWETVTSLLGSRDLPKDEIPMTSCLDLNLRQSYCLTASGKKSLSRILYCFGYNAPDVQYCPILYPLTAILRHYLTEEECYGLICSLVSSRSPKFLSQTKLQHEVDWRTLRDIQKQHNKTAMSYLETLCSPSDIETIFQNWIWIIFGHLPLPHMVRIVDCFIVEGQKILFRVSLSLLRYFVKNLKVSQEWRSKIKDKGLKETFARFCLEFAIAPHLLLERCFRFRGLSKAEIQKQNLTNEVDIKVKGMGEDINSTKVPGLSSKSNDTANFSLRDLKSEILSQKGLITIWKWLPERISGAVPTLAYSSNVHGTSLTTFYSKSEIFEQSVLVIKTTNNEIFGAYCSASWAERNVKDDKGLRKSYFGTGETFLFQLSSEDGGNDAKQYSWINLNCREEEKGLTKAEAHARELFMSGQHDMVSIGGGNGNGIYIDSSLTFGKSETCLTFNNPPLCGGGDFKISLIEVFGINKLDL